jgi:hypothetical protein
MCSKVPLQLPLQVNGTRSHLRDQGSSEGQHPAAPPVPSLLHVTKHTPEALQHTPPICVPEAASLTSSQGLQLLMTLCLLLPSLSPSLHCSCCS